MTDKKTDDEFKKRREKEIADLRDEISKLEEEITALQAAAESMPVAAVQIHFHETVGRLKVCLKLKKEILAMCLNGGKKS